MEIVKADLSAFDFIKDFNYSEKFLKFQNIDMHYIDEGQGPLILALHGEPTWSYLYRKFIPVLSDYRFIAPDLIGFGKSDKLKNIDDYSFEFHINTLKNLIQKLDLKNINLVVQDWGGLLGLSLLDIFPERFSSVIILNTFLPKGNSLPFAFKLWQKFALWHPNFPVKYVMQKLTYNTLSKDILKAYNAPFPNKEHKAGAKAFPQLAPSSPTDPAVPYLLKAREALSNWTKPALIMFSDRDPVFKNVDGFFHKLIPSKKKISKITIKNASHFLQEDQGERIAEYIKLFLEEKLPYQK